MSKRNKVHYQIVQEIMGSFYAHCACMTNWENDAYIIKTVDVDRVTCRNCQNTKAFLKAWGIPRIQEGMRQTVSLKRHITGKPVKRAHYWIEVAGLKLHGVGVNLG